MPRHPRRSAHAEGIRTATFEGFGARLRQLVHDAEFVPLHLGDVFQLPPEASRQIPLDAPEMHRYGPVTGLGSLRAAGAADLRGFGLDVGEEDVFVTAGATGGLDLALNATLEPGDEVLVLTPTWPLVIGLLQRRGCRPVEVDVDPSGWIPDPATLRARLEAHIGERTCGISLCNPNNPSGFVYGAEHLAVVAELAAAHGLWIYYDAVYVDMQFDAPPRPLTAISGWRERAFVVTSFSKSFGLAGQRVGLLATPPAARDLLPRLCTHSIYHCGMLGQRMALAALESDAALERSGRLAAAKAGADLATAALQGLVPFRRPEGGAFVLLDLRERAADSAEVFALLGRCLDAGVSLAPGNAFGERYERFARLCFTSVPPDRLQVGLEHLRTVLSS